MSHELLYTSAQHGLKTGSYGFCTVMATDGLPKALQDRLESLSGYEHPFAVTDKRASLNPINYSHMIVTVANQRSHLLSRIADAGADYSGRSNKLAHHVVLQPSELTAASPASTLATPGFCKTEFDGNPRGLPRGVLPPTTACPPAVCKTWQSVCRDAGWAGSLAEQTLQNPSRPITLIYAPGCDVLSLVIEAISLLPPDRQWRTTFSTFFTRIPAGVECQWRFVLDGTPTADQARRNLQSPPIDLTSPGRIPSEGPLVEAARTGKMPVVTQESIATAVEKSKDSAPEKATAGPGTVRESSVARDAWSDDESETYRLAPRQKRPPKIAADSPVFEDLFSKKNLSPTVLGSIIGGGVLLFVLFIGLGVYAVSGMSWSQPAPAIPEVEKPKVEEIAKPELVAKNDTTKEDLKKAIEPVAVVVAPPKINTVPLIEPPPKEKPIRFEDIVEDILGKGKVLSLPKNEQGVSSIDETEHKLCDLYLNDLSTCELSLQTKEIVSYKDANGTSIERPRVFLKNTDAGKWTAVVREKKPPANEEIIIEIGDFTINNKALYFKWIQAPDWASPYGLLLCKLDVRIGREMIQCSLSQTTHVSIPHLDVTRKQDQNRQGVSFAAGIPAGTLSTASFLRYDIELRLDSWSQSYFGVGDVGFKKFQIPSTSQTEDERIDLEIGFIRPTESREAAFEYRAFVYPTLIKEVSGQDGASFELTSERNDKLPFFKETNGGFRIPDFEPFRKYIVKHQNNAVLQLANVERRLKKSDLSDEEVASLKISKRYWQQLADYTASSVRWIGGTKSKFEDIEKNLEVRFRIYLEFTGGPKPEKVIIVETRQPPHPKLDPSSPGF